jgi:WD40 repeat protein
MWDLQSGKELASFQVSDSPWSFSDSVRFSPGGEKVITWGQFDQRHEVLVLDAHNGRLEMKPLIHGGTVNSAEFGPNGRFILTASSDKLVRVWDANNGDLVIDPLKHSTPVQSAHFSPDGKRILTASGSAIRVWDAESGEPLTDSLDGGVSLLSAQCSPDGERVLTVSADGEARVWDFSPTKTGIPDWFLPLIEAVCGRVLNKQGVLEFVALDRAAVIGQIRQRLMKQPNKDDWVMWGRWFLSDHFNRTISPFSSITIQEYVDDCIKENTDAYLDEAARVAFGNTELMRRISEARKTHSQEK